MFNDRKAGQVAAFFLNAAGGQLDVLKLVKLIYLADREFLTRHGMPITYDRLVSMPHGPVNSQTYNCLNGCAPESDGWEEWVADRSAHMVALAKADGDDALDELSRAELDALRAVWVRFGDMRGWQLRDWTHEHCAEWRDPQGSSLPIAFADVLRAVGRNEEEARDLAARIDEHRRIDSVLATLR